MVDVEVPDTYGDAFPPVSSWPSVIVLIPPVGPRDIGSFKSGY